MVVAVTHPDRNPRLNDLQIEAVADACRRGRRGDLMHGDTSLSIRSSPDSWLSTLSLKTVELAGEEVRGFSVFRFVVDPRSRAIMAAAKADWRAPSNSTENWEQVVQDEGLIQEAQGVIRRIGVFRVPQSPQEANFHFLVDRSGLILAGQDLSRRLPERQLAALTAALVRTFAENAGDTIPSAGRETLLRTLEHLRLVTRGIYSAHEDRRRVLGGDFQEGMSFNELRRMALTRPDLRCRAIACRALGLLANGEDDPELSLRRSLYLTLVEICRSSVVSDRPNRLDYLLPLATRQSVGNPYKPLSFDPAWRSEEVLGLARKMDTTKDFSELGALADELEDLGCMDADIIGHCRGPRPVEASWVVSKVLGHF